MQNVNKIPNNPHGCDFSRVKPWYLENQSVLEFTQRAIFLLTPMNTWNRAKFLRQTLLISRYDTPEFRSLYNNLLFNVEGKLRLIHEDFEGVQGGRGGVRKGVKQVFTRLDVRDGVEEVDVRFKNFVEVVGLFQICSPDHGAHDISGW